MPTPSGQGSRAPQKSNTIVVLQPVNVSDIRLIAADIGSGMLTCAIVRLDALHVADRHLAMEPVLTACLDRHLITAPVGTTTLVIGPDIEVRQRRHIEVSPGSCKHVYRKFEPSPTIPCDYSNLADAPFHETFEQTPWHQYQEREDPKPTTSEALRFLFPERSDEEIFQLLNSGFGGSS